MQVDRLSLVASSQNPEIRHRFELAVFLIAVGLREKEEAHEKDNNAYAYSSAFRHGLGVFAALCAECAGENAARMLDGLSESSFVRGYCTKDVAEWVARWDAAPQEAVLESETAAYGPLAVVDGNYFAATQDCTELIVHAECDTVAAFQERKVYDHLRSGTQQQYVLGRKFLVQHPVLSWDEYSRAKTGRYDFSADALDQDKHEAYGQSWFEELLSVAYEQAPRGAVLCPSCGWTMVLDGKQARCALPSCVDGLPADLTSLDAVPHGSFRLRRGVARYISAPGRLEMAIAEEAAARGLPFEFWPRMDTCDVLIAVPSGRRIAVDAKAYGSASRLAREVKGDPAMAILQVDEFVYVIPDETERKHPGFCAVCNSAIKIREGYSCMTLHAFAKHLDALQKGASDYE